MLIGPLRDVRCAMAISDAVLRQVFENAGGQCECSRRIHRHFYTPCGRLLRWEKRGQSGDGGWEERKVDALGTEDASNYEILCMECHDSIR